MRRKGTTGKSDCGVAVLKNGIEMGGDVRFGFQVVGGILAGRFEGDVLNLLRHFDRLP
jgi:hypothetical protein